MTTSTLEEIEKRRAERKNKFEDARTRQTASDLAAIDEVEASTGEPLHVMTANTFKPGVSVKLAFRAPTGGEYKLYCDKVVAATSNKNVVKGAAERRQAQEAFAEACLVYPPAGETRKAMLDAFPGLLLSVAIEAAKVAELASDEEGKG